MKRTTLVLSILLFVSLAAGAQEPAPSLPPAKAGTAAVQFVFDWSVQNPPRYEISVDSTGRATYHCEPAADEKGGSAPDAYSVEWTASEATRTKIFDAAEKLDYFKDGNYDTKAKVAKTGVKTLTYKDGSRDSSTRYNYSENPLVRDLTHIFQSIATTAEMGRKLRHDFRFDKLGVEADLKALQEEQKQGNALEFGSIAPILQKIIDDPNMMRMSQQRAKDMLRVAALPNPQTSAAK
ncbi:hypothetical protein Acid345_3617 [Candidatus Koribacter versatilis Ellin345]|uniref:Uncharacterized protein n=1 Tax=Koribacter versatilis (strain Ellin345) TaxID=204669 RepID=Q1IKI2_KORVE|nr:hypothetical protein [Candidatus Koribacter versatilis]ABF42618.1 hypothetical protein Acid345_3617 [Candidatus Koribacter versatilis Ellin345]